MDGILHYILKIKVPTRDVKLKDLQELLQYIKAVKDDQKQTEDFEKQCSEILKILWLHLKNGFNVFDDQLLCSTCFYTILNLSSNKEDYFKSILHLINIEINFKMKGIESGTNISNTISLIYGIFQSPILLHVDDIILEDIINKIFTLVTLMAYEYSQFTFIIFRIMTFFKKAVGTHFENIIFNENNNLNLLNVINHNWENPINGIRNLNKIIFQNLISVLDKGMFDTILKDLNDFYWNKAKYLMFSEVVEQYEGNIQTLTSKYKLVRGLGYSLHKAGLVSAGADMYIAVVNKIKTDEEWCTIFLDCIIEIFNSASIKPIENFINYWCLNTLKLFPTLVKPIFYEIEKLRCTEHKLFICLSFMQQSNKLGLLEKNCNQTMEIVLNGIEHSDAKTRALAFDVLCGTRATFSKDHNEYDVILDFLTNNVNSDCSILRISMIETLQKFLSKMHITFLNNFQNNDDDIKTDFLKFCRELQVFIINSLSYNGNYQRKIATLLVTKVMLSSFKNVPRKKQKQTRHCNTTLIEFLKNEHHWLLTEKSFVLKLIDLLKDPSDDIREQIMDILLINYSDQLTECQFMECLTKEAVTLIKSRFFYQISCGQAIFKLILNLLLMKKCTTGQFKEVEDVFEFAYKIIKTELNIKIDIVKSINEGKQFHAYLSILYSVFEVCLEKSHNLNITTDIITSLVGILDCISNQFAWEQETSVSSDFSKMSDMVQEIIANSDHKINHGVSETNISGLHQIVLNCLWLNVKASCQLSSILIKYYKDDKHIEICEKCLHIICNVLETSRHKGAIEAGGASLGLAIQQLTYLTDGLMISNIPKILLKNKLNDLISETSNMASVTRRGAGLSIMIHRIVSSDRQKGKPLFHYFMQVLLETCKKLSKSETSYENDTSNEKDLPKAIYIHFLTKIVIDSSLASDALYYSATLAEIAFDNLTDPCWQIRNAALQLYGSLIPKLIGQKKKSGENEEVIATVAVDEFRTHSPKLWNYIVSQLKGVDELCDAIQSHNNLVPILSIIANMAPMYTFIDRKEIDNALLPNLQSLLGSPIYVVRRLTAKCILNIYTFEVILEFLSNYRFKTENSLHGTLMLLNEFIRQYNGNRILRDNIEVLKYKYTDIIMAKSNSFICREKFEYIFPDCINTTDSMVRETLLEIKRNGKCQGVFLWANFRIQRCLENISWDKIPEIVTLLVDCNEFETHCESLYIRIKNDKYIPEEILGKLCDILYCLGFQRKTTIIWKILYEISIKTEMSSDHIDTSLLYKYFVEHELSYGMRYMIPFAARICNNNVAEETLSKITLQLSSPEIVDTDMRLVAAMASNELARKFRTLSDQTKINILKAVIMLLQDEDEDIRNCSVHFYRLVHNMFQITTHPYICLRKILTYNFINLVVGISPSGMKSLCKDLKHLVESLILHNDDEYNPFACDSKNIYLEQELMKKVLDELEAA